MDVNELIELGKKLDMSTSRFPYTYHHDLLRMKVYSANTSRSDVSKMSKNQSDEELYSLALMGLVEQNDVADTILKMDTSDFEVIKEALQFAKETLDKIKEEYKQELLSKIPS